jgi:GrpB-like predicted nucleotidyltransferase (UPF0157 family)
MKIGTETIIEPSEKIFDIQQKSLEEIKTLLPNSQVEAVGAMAVPMVGRPELDIMVIGEHVEEDSKILAEYGYKQGPIVEGTSFLKMVEDGIEVAVQIMSPENHMINIHRNIIGVLCKNDELRKQYEEFKKTLSGLSKEEYKKKKGEWIKENIKPLLK